MSGKRLCGVKVLVFLLCNSAAAKLSVLRNFVTAKLRNFVISCIRSFVGTFRQVGEDESEALMKDAVQFFKAINIQRLKRKKERWKKQGNFRA